MTRTAAATSAADRRRSPSSRTAAPLLASTVDATQAFQVAWGDLDGNAHMRNTAYLDRAADARLRFFAGQGFDPGEFARLRMGPVMLRDEIEYRRELHLLQHARVDCALAGLSEDGSRFRIRNRFRRADGTLAATVTSTGGWLHLDRRRLVAPPPALLAAVQRLPRSDDFHALDSSVARDVDAKRD